MLRDASAHVAEYDVRHEHLWGSACRIVAQKKALAEGRAVRCDYNGEYAHKQRRGAVENHDAQ